MDIKNLTEVKMFLSVPPNMNYNNVPLLERTLTLIPWLKWWWQHFSNVAFWFFSFQSIKILEGDSLRLILASMDGSLLTCFYSLICLMVTCFWPHLYELIFSNLLGCSGGYWCEQTDLGAVLFLHRGGGRSGLLLTFWRLRMLG